MESCQGAGYTGCVACGAGPHQPCRYGKGEHDHLYEEHPIYNSRIYEWMGKRFDVPRSTFMIFALLGFLLGLSTCGMLA